jgi:phosphoglycerate kinase
MKTLSDISLKNKKILIRADLNVPLDDNKQVTDANRIKQFIPTLKYVVENGGIPIVMSHFDDPKGVPNDDLSLRHIVSKFAELSNLEVVMAKDCIGDSVQKQIEALKANQVLLLENLRFHSGETANNQEFAKQLAKLADVYVSDAFATAHRSHASMVSVPRLMKEKAAGFLMQKEMDFYNKALISPNRPLCVILGGAKVSSKLNTLMNISDRADKLIIGGAMANTFLAAQGFQMGRSLYEPELYGKCLEILGKLARRGAKVYLPVDFKVAESPKPKAGSRVVTAQEIPADTMALDIGPATNLLYQTAITDCATIVWNGPMGLFEEEEFSQGTCDLITALGSAHGMTLVGGGDTDAAIHKMELEHKFDYISTGGGAFLALLEGQTLPGVAALD